VELARRVHEVTERVRAGNIAAAELRGASVTLTNIGAFDVTGGTPFIIPGQLAMLAAGSILQRPRALPAPDGKWRVEPRLILNLRLVFDHRPFNGSHAASFLQIIKNGMERLDVQELMK
jgi:pyruvate dehydrogenase E2 component (dihydrolipoamide acetyltransferase)